MYKTILVPTDGTPLSDKAISAAVQYAQKHPECKIIGLSVAEPVPLSDYEHHAQEIAREKVTRIAELAQAANVSHETLVRGPAKPHEEIVRVANEYHCDCIFMASHGRKGLDKIFIGSETQKVLAMTDIPVLVYR